MTRDLTDALGPMFRDGGWAPEIPMYSYERPAYILWQAIFTSMVEGGATQEQAIEWLQSKDPRRALDGSLGDSLRSLGKAYGEGWVSAFVYKEQKS